MSAIATYRLVHEEARRRAAEFCATAPDGLVVQFKQPTRSLEQNAAMWSMLSNVSAQVEWHGRYLSAQAWKHIFTAALCHQDVVPNLANDGFVVLGTPTSTMSKTLMRDLLELIQSFGVEKGVRFTVGGPS